MTLALRGFRKAFYGCLQRRVDALFELADAILTAGAVPSPPYLSLASVHRRGWGSIGTPFPSKDSIVAAGDESAMNSHGPILFP
jgi:hypothetical protein